ncbi:hypothetical protein FRC08_011727 [Ceratobasidium sp. 394]|nr:hypothetical protein FRC08_011727 [Ceratobasidium sp. 394]KAG9099489.1 hypothetical protein FS749_001170 [Ceratobasidium sp. UAMH 11750]
MRRDGARGLPKTGAAQIEWNLTGTMLLVRFESVSTALHIYNFPSPDEPFKPGLRTVLLHASAVARACWNPVRAETLALCCSRPGVYIWTASNDWISEGGELDGEGAECMGVPGQELNVRDVRWAPDGRGLLMVDSDTYCCAFEVDDEGQPA